MLLYPMFNYDEKAAGNYGGFPNYKCCSELMKQMHDEGNVEIYTTEQRYT